MNTVSGEQRTVIEKDERHLSPRSEAQYLCVHAALH